MKKGLPLGIENFPDMIRKNCYYVDKTAFIKPIMEVPRKVLLITRPRCFGKTVFMDTLKCFLQIDFEHPGDTAQIKSLFDGLRVSEDEDFCRTFMGQCPVISVSLKDVEGATYEKAYRQFAAKLSAVAGLYSFLSESPRLSTWDKAAFRQYLDKNTLRDLSHEDDCKDFLKNLTMWLSKHFEKQVVLLVDEYDVPLAKAAQFGYYTEMLELIRAFLGQVLKEDPQAASDASAYLGKAVLTGCQRVSKESIFTGTNNPAVNSVCSEDRTLNRAIGFGEDDVEAMLAYYGLSGRCDDVRRWYDGYRLAGCEIYCPWDVLNFCDHAIASGMPDRYQPENYWEGTSGNEVISEFLGFLTTEDADKMQVLVDGGSVDLTVNDKLTYSDFADHHSDDFWTLLLFSGYLTVTERLPGMNVYRVRIPNEEIRDTFEKKVRALYSENNRRYARYGENLAKAFLTGDAGEVRSLLIPLLRRYVSVRDGATKAPPENYYHGFLMAMLICAGDKVVDLRSNAEAGTGFADVTFVSEKFTTGVVIEIKRCRKPEEMMASAKAGLAQIRQKEYAAMFEGAGCSLCYGFGIAFCQKMCAVVSEPILIGG